MIIINTVSVKAIDIYIEESNFYFTFVSNNGRNFSDKAVKYYINGKPSYCIEPGVPLGSSDYYESNLDNLDSNVRNKILKYMYYGYLYKGHEDNNYYYATQDLIWEELLNDKSGVVFSTNLFKKGNIIDLSIYKNEIINTINKHNVGPYNYGETYDVYLGSNITINDTGNASLYRMDYDKDIFDIEVVNNNIVINNFLKTGTYNINFYEDEYYLDDYMVYKNDTKQDMLVLGNIELYDYKLSFNILGCDLSIIKKDSISDEVLEDATYGLFDMNDNKLNELITDEKGEASINEISYDKYYIKEIKAPKDHEIDDTKYYIEFNDSNRSINLVVKDDPIVVIDNVLSDINDMEDELIINNVPNTNKDYSFMWIIVISGVLFVKKKCC